MKCAPLILGLLTYAGDIDATNKLLEWIQELGGCGNHDLVLVCDAATPAPGVFRALELGSKIFKSTKAIYNKQSVIGWIEGPKSLVLRMMEFAHEVQRPWLLLDSDAIPLKAGWLDQIEQEYQSSGKRYMGYLFQCRQPGLPLVLMSPIAVYHENALAEVAPAIRGGNHWDVSMTGDVLKSCHNTKLIQHLFGEMGNPPTFAERGIPGTKVFGVDQINPGAVVFHRNKDFTLIGLLRNRMGIARPQAPPEEPKAFFQMGRFGDLILLMPAYKEWADRTGRQVVVFTSKEFGTVFEGVSYVKPVLLDHNWHLRAGDALRFARSIYPHVIRTQLHGVGLVPATPDTLASFSLSMWERAGLLDRYNDLPLVFDRRSVEREKELVKQWKKTDKPMLLVNFDGRTSPLPSADQFIRSLCQKFGGEFEFVNTNEVRAYRIFDLLGLMDIAAGLITIDTATVHLAAGGKCPYIAIVRDDGQGGSIPKGKVALKVGYSQAIARLPEIFSVMEGWK